MLKAIPIEPRPAPAAPEAAAPRRVIHEEPAAGGSYLRDPVTGALTPNPASKE